MVIKDDDDYFKPERLSNFQNNNYIEYKSNSNRNKNLSIDKNFNKTGPNLRNIIIDL